MRNYSADKLPILILGAGGHAKVLIDILVLQRREIIGILDPDISRIGQEILGVKIIGDDAVAHQYKPSSIRLVNGLGSVNSVKYRKSIYEKFKSEGYDFAIRSYRKFLPQPDGASLIYKHPIDIKIEEPNEAFLSQKLVGKLLRGEHKNENEYLRLFLESENCIDQKIIPRKMSWISKYILDRTDIESVKAARRRNWSSLSSLIAESIFSPELFMPLYSSIEEGEIPLGYPIVVNNGLRDRLRSYLCANNIFCPVHWPIVEQYYSDYKELACEKELSSKLLTLPIDQRLNLDMICYMAERLNRFMREI
ncbi:MAG: hypothetical protein GX963_03450 [Bacteroidales bacterium]|nr:hypothetical protein [Bacteroidales bacterium]